MENTGKLSRAIIWERVGISIFYEKKTYVYIDLLGGVIWIFLGTNHPLSIGFYNTPPEYFDNVNTNEDDQKLQMKVRVQGKMPEPICSAKVS